MRKVYTVQLDVWELEREYVLKQFVGEGEYDGEPIEALVALPDMSPMLKIQDTTYTIKASDIHKAIANMVLAQRSIPDEETPEYPYPIPGTHTV